MISLRKYRNNGGKTIPIHTEISIGIKKIFITYSNGIRHKCAHSHTQISLGAGGRSISFSHLEYFILMWFKGMQLKFQISQIPQGNSLHTKRKASAINKIFLLRKRKSITKRSLCIQKKPERDFPGGPVVKNPPSNAGDAGSIPRSGN